MSIINVLLVFFFCNVKKNITKPNIDKNDNLLVLYQLVAWLISMFFFLSNHNACRNNFRIESQMS